MTEERSFLILGLSEKKITKVLGSICEYILRRYKNCTIDESSKNNNIVLTVKSKNVILNLVNVPFEHLSDEVLSKKEEMTTFDRIIGIVSSVKNICGMLFVLNFDPSKSFVASLKLFSCLSILFRENNLSFLKEMSILIPDYEKDNTPLYRIQFIQMRHLLGFEQGTIQILGIENKNPDAGFEKIIQYLNSDFSEQTFRLERLRLNVVDYLLYSENYYKSHRETYGNLIKNKEEAYVQKEEQIIQTPRAPMSPSSSSKIISESSMGRQVNGQIPSFEYKCVFLGQTGSGKSTIINYIANYFEGNNNFDQLVDNPASCKIAIKTENWTSCVMDRFKSLDVEKNLNDTTKSHTSGCQEYKIRLNSLNDSLLLVDTPGFNDTAGSEHDFVNIEKIKQTFIQLEKVHAIAIVVNGTNCRFNLKFKTFIEQLVNELPNDMRKNIILVATNCTEIGCNFDLKMFENIIDVKKVYYMQNNFFRWNQKDRDAHILSKYRSHWANSIEVIKSIITNLKTFLPISTSFFTKINNKEAKISEVIKERLTKEMKEMFESYIETQVLLDALSKNQIAIESNKSKIKVYQVEGYDMHARKKIIKVEFPDRASEHKYREYQKQYDANEAQLLKIGSQIENFKTNIEKNFRELKLECDEMRKLNTNTNFLNKFKAEIKLLEQLLKNKQNQLKFNDYYKLEEYFDRILVILGIPTNMYI